ncbi:hypothetical protein N800_05025 [Lysobacter daejeonensis GH1-9]|uniref:DUF885 domain-containing protein n=1 Tax=Lysobacter daejeonensis GH1-9 TaxID=1385517 RepID=A0A0A0EYP5_9GAMM|nr:hypothetical protein N800_05025 [Lysobacter daejeonensis GH1-9]
MKPLLPTLLALHLALAPIALARADASSADARFEAIYAKEWTWRQRETGGADEDSDTSGGNTRLPTVDAASQQARLKVWEGVLRQLDAVDANSLSAENRINLAVYRAQVENLAADVRLRGYEMPFNSDSSFWSNLGFMARTTFKDTKDAEAYVARLNDVPRHFNQQIGNMRAGLARGFSVPRAVLDGRDVSIAAVTQLRDPEQATLYAPFRKLPNGIAAADQARLREAARTAIKDKVIPAYGTLLAFFRNEYVPKARTTLGASQMPGGADYYRQQIREYTTLDLSPDEIHAIGLQEVARIQAQMDAIIQQVGFKAPEGQATFPAFLHFLRTDPQFYVTTPQALLERAAWIAKRVDGEVGKVIGTLPRGRFTIIPVPDDIAPFWTAGRGGNGTYWVNTYNLPSRPLYNLPALTLHEASPGHALQGALAEEQTGQPDFRRKSYISAYGEGWALYTEKLGQEMGIYQTPYEEFGRLTYEMWRACRLVIDTGIHAKGWTREQALAYLRDRTALSEHEVTTEVDRYISWPGQALSYKLGEIAIVKLRAEAERELGTRFDVKTFHDAILRQGSLPLPVLETEVRRWIAETKAAPAEGASKSSDKAG